MSCGPPNKRVEETGDEAARSVRASVIAGRSRAIR